MGFGLVRLSVKHNIQFQEVFIAWWFRTRSHGLGSAKIVPPAKFPIESGLPGSLVCVLNAKEKRREYTPRSGLNRQRVIGNS